VGKTEGRTSLGIRVMIVTLKKKDEIVECGLDSSGFGY
jgi:hypothetical protein